MSKNEFKFFKSFLWCFDDLQEYFESVSDVWRLFVLLLSEIIKTYLIG